MPVPNTMADLAQLASSNFPTGTESIGNNLDNYIRALSAIIRSTNAVASASIASASTTNLASADGESVLITGTSTINSFGTGFVGCYRELVFSGACTIVNSSNIILLSGNIVTATDVVLSFRCVSPGVWRLGGGNRDYSAVRRSGDTMTGNLFVQGTVHSSGTTGEWASVNLANSAYVAARHRAASYDFRSGPTPSDLSFLSSDTAGNWVARGSIGVSGPAAASSDFASAIRIRESAATGETRRMDVWVAGPVDTPASQVVEFRSILVGGTRFNTPQLYCSGSIGAGGGFDVGSSIKLKDIEGPLSYGLEAVERMALVEGRYKKEYNDDGRRRLFFVAEQLAGLIPEAVDEEGVEFEGERVPSVKLDQVLPVLAKAIQELSAEVRLMKRGGLK